MADGSYFAGKRVFISGGSCGIGRALGIDLAKQGASVAICARRPEPLDEAVAAMKNAARDSTQEFLGIVADVTDRRAVQAAMDQTTSKLGGLDVLVANSGFAQAKLVSDAPPEHFRQLMDVNYFGHVNLVQASLAHFTKQRRGDIVLVASMLAIFGSIGFAGYAASKFAIRGFAEALRQEMRAHGVRVKLFLPPTTDTPGLEMENRDKPDVTLEMEMGSSLNVTHSAPNVAAAIRRWIPKRGFLGVAGFDSWLQALVVRLFPGFALWLVDREMDAAVKRLEKKRLEAKRV